ncbi:MAG TPA: hypothetical protein VEX60_04320 [Pyrinomonadaceae bacterium]|nr:hypothetical protein [Pyrinomonadaceae bacterium]
MMTATTTTPAQTEPARRPRRRRRVLTVITAIVLLLAAWVAYDLYAPRRTSLRDFDADEVARLETAMWRSYYSRERARLFAQLGELLRTQYRMPLVRSNAVAYRAAKAAFVFKDGKARADYEKALPNLVSYYKSIREVSDTDFDVERAARLELEWWIVHRERARHAPGDLERALASLASEIYRIPAEHLAEHARLRAEAMKIRDTKAEQGGVTEDDWKRIDELLHDSWRSLHHAVNS